MSSNVWKGGFGVVTFADWRGRSGPAMVGELEAYRRYCVASEVVLGLSGGCRGVGCGVGSVRRCRGCTYAEALAGGCFEQRFSGCGIDGLGVIGEGSGVLGGRVELPVSAGGRIFQCSVDASSGTSVVDGRVLVSGSRSGVDGEGNTGRNESFGVVVKSPERATDGGRVEGVGSRAGAGAGCSGGVLGAAGRVQSHLGHPGPGAVSDPVVDVSPKTLLNRERRRVAKERKKRKQEAAKSKSVDNVPEWRKKFATGVLADSWEKRKVLENEIAILKAKEQIKRLESGAGKPRLQSKVLSEAEQEAKIRADYDKHMQKTRADIAYWKRRTEAGAVEKAIKLEMEIMDGQISGKYDPFASRRTIGWAKTVKTNSTGESSARKTVWSGSGASGRTDTVSKTSGSSVVSMEKYLADIEIKDKQSKDREDKLKKEIQETKLMVKNAEEKAAFFRKKALERRVGTVGL